MAGEAARAGTAHDLRAAELCAAAMCEAQAVGGSITSESALGVQASTIGWRAAPEVAAELAEAERAARALDTLQRDYRAATIKAVAPGSLTAANAFTRIEAVRQLDRIAHHAWCLAAHLRGVDRGNWFFGQNQTASRVEGSSARAGRAFIPAWAYVFEHSRDGAPS